MATIAQLKQNYDVTDHTEERVAIPEKPKEGLVLLVGSSGSGKSTILRHWFDTFLEDDISISRDKMVIENFSSLERGEELLKSFGLRSIPTWFRPYHTLSNGEAHRAYCALSVDRGRQYIDEFSSVVDRDTAKSLAVSVRKFHTKGLLVIATCHRDVEEWLCPDVVYDTDRKQFIDRRYLRRPEIKFDIVSSSIKDWVLFKKHHYLSSDVNKACHFYTGYVAGKPVAFLAVLHRTNGSIRSYWGECRLVVLPEFQGQGLGKLMSETIAQEYIDRGFRYFSKTSHPVLGKYRNGSSKWKPTTRNGSSRSDYLAPSGKKTLEKKGYGSIFRDAARACYSHEYIGEWGFLR
jgi:ABC-type lipoprotein export system ATPase subunit/GNAT superfamily N-acetyltransferase